MRTRARIQAAARALARRVGPPGGFALACAPLLVVGPLAAPGRDPVEMVFVMAFLILSLALHEVAHAWVALMCGDPTARDLGRLSLNPIVHIDPVWTVIVPAVTYMTSGAFFGGAKPVPVDYRRLRHPLRDMSLVAAAGPLTNLILAALFLMVWKAAVQVGSYETNQLLPRVLLGSAQFNVLLCLFNLIPIPPLDGSRIMTWVLPAGMRQGYASLERFGLLLIFGLIFFVPGFWPIFIGAIESTVGFLDTITGGTW